MTGTPDLTQDLPATAQPAPDQAKYPDMSRGEVVLHGLYLDTRPIAVYFGYKSAGWYGAYRTAFDQDLAGLSPGHVLLRMMVARMRASRLSVLDLMRGDHEYKGMYASRVNVKRRVEAGVPDGDTPSRRRSRNGIGHVTQESLRRVKEPNVRCDRRPHWIVDGHELLAAQHCDGNTGGV